MGGLIFFDLTRFLRPDMMVCGENSSLAGKLGARRLNKALSTRGQDEQGMNLALTFAAALLAGLALARLKVPGGMMLGAAIGACAFNLAFGAAQMPALSKTIAQVVVGAFIGSGVNRQELKQMKGALKPALTVILGLLALNVLTGLLIHRFSSLDLLTALMSTTPGGISDMPIVAAEMGADASKVLVLQFIRFAIGIGVFPSLIGGLTREEAQNSGEAVSRPKREGSGWLPVLLTLAAAAACGLLGRLSGLPAGTMAFATIGSIVFKLLYPGAFIPAWLRRGAQCLSGAFIGASIGFSQVRDMLSLPVPILILLLSLLTGTLALGYLLFRMRAFTLREGMLAATPAGASDMALISADLGISNINLVLMHVMRVIAVITFFPAILKWLAGLMA